MNTKKLLRIQKEIDAANQKHVEDWKNQQAKPCPFCGGDVAITYNHYGDYWQFHCPGCNFVGSFGPASSSIRWGDKEGSRKKALERWNKRV